MGTASGKGGLMWRAAPDQSYRLFRYTPQILHSTYAQILGHSQLQILSHSRLPILGHSRLPTLGHSRSLILGYYERAYIHPPRSSTAYATTYVYKYPS
ncbi:uncharacterized protein BDCG_16733 [Blastomyces dermatitidis ER-3]|uniref:Uncharacterized protein n=1 Tax=Ajellomyces dermatitidis (strain ER-3 / ATCC MYA-2586) TaxID=559297 RepID=A0ABX2VUB2_AJEDR|nr:uncharacterized protein BDCG_16733 [Blastomyces dermatitidis ER-3]OAT00672.1 hypothetical protein BDCG_16733 [Blastomyces dermatitidis ER-3]